MTTAHVLVQLIYAQAIAFGLGWATAFLVGHRVRFGHWTLSLAYVGALEAAALALVARVHGPLPPPAWWLPIVAVAVAVIALADDWNAPAQACMTTTLALSGLFIAYVVRLTARAHLGPLSLGFSLVLLALQTFALVLLCAGSFEILDVLGRIRWRRTAPPPPADAFPRVSLHVPAYNEPPEMVIETLEALARLDYPSYEVIVVDDNTTDESLWRPVERRCRELGFAFHHLENWPGFKSGALNFALGRTDPAAEIVGVVDSDYVVEPGYLRACVGAFQDPAVAFVQTPQDYRGVAPDDRYAQACYDAYRYFFRVSMASRNERNGIIFAGTMGLIRRRVLESLGGWDEWCITEDAELSLRILDRGHRGVYVDRSFGHGLMPLNFEGLKKQRFRWAFGGMQILRRHAGALLPWARWVDPAHRLTPGQQWDYLMGGLQWLNDPVTFAFTLLLLLGSAALLAAHSLFIQPLAPAVLIVPFLFIFVGVSRFLWALRVRIGCSLRRALDAFTILLALTWVVTLACVLGWVKREGVFLRTPKRRTDTDRWHAWRVVSHETVLAALCAAAGALLIGAAPRSPHVWVMSGLLGWQTLIFGSALTASRWGRRSELRVLHPEYLRATRTTGQRVSSMVTDRLATWGVAALAAVALIAFVLAVRLAPESERAFRTNPEHAAFVPAAAMQTSPETQVRAALYLEKEAAMSGDVNAALALWDSAGRVRDVNYTPADTTDDSVWVGAAAVRRRYVGEFARHRYLALAHADASVVIEGDRAVVVNDLHATVETPAGIQRIFLSHGDRWTLVRRPEGWRIVELIVNRAPR